MKRARAKTAKTPVVRKHQKGNAQARSQAALRRLFPSLIAMVCMAGVSVVVLNSDRPGRIVVDAVQFSSADVPPSIAPKLEQPRWEEFYEDVQAALARARARQQAALERVEKRVDALFNGYRAGITPLIEEVTGVRTRASIVKASLQDAFDDGRRAHDIVHTIFAGHLFSEETLTVAVRAIVDGFQEDLDASRNRLLSEVRAAAVERGVPRVMSPKIDEFARSVGRRSVSTLSEGVRHDIAQAGGAFAASTASGMVTELIVRRVIQRLAVQLAARVGTIATSAGGAAAAGAAGGAAVGSGFPGLGTVIGVVAGVTIGMTVDHYLSEKAEQEFRESLTTFIADAQRDLMEGSEPHRVSRRPFVLSHAAMATSSVRA